MILRNSNLRNGHVRMKNKIIGMKNDSKKSVKRNIHVRTI